MIHISTDLATWYYILWFIIDGISEYLFINKDQPCCSCQKGKNIIDSMSFSNKFKIQLMIAWIRHYRHNQAISKSSKTRFSSKY